MCLPSPESLASEKTAFVSVHLFSRRALFHAPAMQRMRKMRFFLARKVIVSVFVTGLIVYPQDLASISVPVLLEFTAGKNRRFSRSDLILFWSVSGALMVTGAAERMVLRGFRNQLWVIFDLRTPPKSLRQKYKSDRLTIE